MTRSHHPRLTIAIDGPAGAGKSTVARRVAEALGYLHIDTGAMYRALTLKALRLGVNLDDPVALGELARRTHIALERTPAGNRVLLDGEDVTSAIRDETVSRHVSVVAAHAPVRERLVELQRELARDGGVVLEGRDIGSRVLPNADRKFYLDADIRERARRRAAELAAAGRKVSVDEVEAEIRQRDYLDTHREVAPLVRVPEAIYVDTTGRTIDEVVKEILGYCR